MNSNQGSSIFLESIQTKNFHKTGYQKSEYSNTINQLRQKRNPNFYFQPQKNVNSIKTSKSEKEKKNEEEVIKNILENISLKKKCKNKNKN
jgi:hypothetical protein